jgi:hypothetical protein
MAGGPITTTDLKRRKAIGSADTLKATGCDRNRMLPLPRWNDLAGHCARTWPTASRRHGQVAGHEPMTASILAKVLPMSCAD